MSVSRCKHCNRPIVPDTLTINDWIHEKPKAVPARFYSCSMYRRKSKHYVSPPFAEPKEPSNVPSL